MAAQYVLGMDLGTTSIKVVLLDSQSKTVTDSRAFPASSDVSNEDAEHAKEQDPARIVSALDQCMAALPKEKLNKVICIGVSGQMHGVVFWKSRTGCKWSSGDAGHTFIPQDVSRLITWQDGRCSSDFLSSLPKPESHLSVATGFGCASIFWYTKHRPALLSEFSVAGTIQDYVVSMLCGSEDCVMTGQNAASWGYFNTTNNQWNMEILKGAGFPVHLLPVPVESGSIAGRTCSAWHGIPADTPVGAALGDFQCSVYSCMRDKADAVLNLSTSAQLTFAMPADFTPPIAPDPVPPIAYFPYFHNTYLAVAASLNGGNVMATFVGMLTSWMKELGVELSESKVYSTLVQCALTQPNTDLCVTPTLLGERHNPTSLGRVSDISPTNLSLGHVTRGVCRGILANLATMMPPQMLLAAGVKRIMGSGSALSRNEVLKQEVERMSPLPVVYGEDVDSAVGVAMVFNDKLCKDTARSISHSVYCKHVT
ncbi:sedoheptulokinase [Pygocentrus nattereri]|uniref:Sedoheptulokinase n=1 Tax=Pygocentrus nattereri TaxID=42514 RepID=A0A3B4BYQ4_PYGNA|nr:sedoheptulokinase [Pygocentrus nattereri]